MSSSMVSSKYKPKTVFLRTLLTAIAETYLRNRKEATFDHEDFDSLSNKFVSKLVIKAN